MITGGQMAQVRGLGPRVSGRLALFCIHRVNRVYGALAVTSWIGHGFFTVPYKLSYYNYYYSN